VALPYHENKRDRWSENHGKSRSALNARGEKETEYPYSREWKDMQAGVRDFQTKGGPIERLWKALKKRL
jgi:hypothetical protein